MISFVNSIHCRFQVLILCGGGGRREKEWPAGWVSGAWSKDLWRQGCYSRWKGTPEMQTWGMWAAGTHPNPLTLNLQMLFPVDDFWWAKEVLTVLGVFGVDLVSIGVVIKVICHLLFVLRKVVSTEIFVFVITILVFRVPLHYNIFKY